MNNNTEKESLLNENESSSEKINPNVLRTNTFFTQFESPKKKTNLIDLVKSDTKFRLWECILTSIISIISEDNDELLYDINQIKINSKEEILKNQKLLSELTKESHFLEIEQIIYNKNEDQKESFLKIVNSSSPKRNSIIDHKRGIFLEKSIKRENKFDIALKFKITQFGTQLFNMLKQNDNILNIDLLDSFSLEKNFDLKVSNTKEFLGKSGSLFFFSFDNKYVLKSISHSNFISILNNLKQLFEYFIREENDSLLGKIYGVFTIEVNEFDKIYLILMNNIMYQLREQKILRIYDLKGSKQNREHDNFHEQYEAQVKKLESLNNIEDIQKNEIQIVRGTDVDFLKSDDVFIIFRNEDKLEIIQTIEKDVNLLISCNLMDYSLIFIKALRLQEIKLDEKQQVKENKFRKYKSPDGKYYYCFAIVDYLQTYDIFKVLESQMKSIIYNPDEISCIDPIAYGERFIKFINSLCQSEI